MYYSFFIIVQYNSGNVYGTMMLTTIHDVYFQKKMCVHAVKLLGMIGTVNAYLFNTSWTDMIYSHQHI